MRGCTPGCRDDAEDCGSTGGDCGHERDGVGRADAAAPIQFSTVALSGQPAADIGGGVTYGELGMAELDDQRRGRVLVRRDVRPGR